VRPLVALALVTAGLATAGPAAAYCTPGGVVPQAACSRVPERVPQCWVNTYTKMVTCEYIVGASR
jgi:hypothetical protein